MLVHRGKHKAFIRWPQYFSRTPESGVDLVGKVVLGKGAESGLVYLGRTVENSADIVSGG